MNTDEKDDAETLASNIVNSLNAAISKAIVICFAVKFLISISLYVILQQFVNQSMAELWMLCVFGFMLFKYETLISAIIKTDLLKKTINGDENEEKDKDSEQEDVE